MTDYLLFIDTEASGLPKRWDVPYAKQGNWPHAVQIAWAIYNRDGEEVKHQNHYIKDDDFEITKSAKKIHGITREFLNSNGESREKVMALLANDLIFYQPLVIGHFMELDFHVVGVEFYRTGIENPLNDLRSFCIMLATTHMVRNPAKKYLRLADLYNILFNATLQHQHDAIVDARATATCFFELIKRGELDDNKIEQQRLMLKPNTATANKQGCSTLMLLFIMILLITILYA